MIDALSYIDFTTIWDLPWTVKGPGLFLIALFLFRAIRCLFSLRLITLFTSVVYAFVIAILLSAMGPMIAEMMKDSLGNEGTQSSIQYLLNNSGNPLA